MARERIMLFIIPTVDGMSNVAVDSDRAVIMKQSSRLWMQVEKSVKTKKQNWSSTA